MIPSAVAGATGLLVLAPAWSQLRGFDHHNTVAIDVQRRAEVLRAAQVDRLIAVIKRDRGGRVYAGMPSNWGMNFTVGAVPVFKFLESRDVDEVGYTLRTASLMTDPEYYFDENNVSDYSLFGIRYLILPVVRSPAIPAQRITCAGPYCLWRSLTNGYVHVGKTVGVLTGDRTNIGVRSISLLRSPLARAGAYLRVNFGRGGSALPTRPPDTRVHKSSVVGSVVSENDNLDLGDVTATVRMRRPGVIVLSASFDPGWTATVDGQRQRTEMVAPALAATELAAGFHTVAFHYSGFGYYLELFLLSGASLGTLLIVDLRRRVRGRRSSHDVTIADGVSE